MRHPAKYSDILLPMLDLLLRGYETVLDPFAGTGKLRNVRPDAHLIEIEPEWAAISGATIGNALALPYSDNSIDAVCTSPTYGNRMADHHDAKDGSRRNTYKHCLGRELHQDNSGQLQWGDKYREFHAKAWREVKRVLRPDGLFVLNISDHIRKGQVQPVTEWHITQIESMGFAVVDHFQIETPRLRYGSNSNKRVTHESIVMFKRGI